MKKIMIAMAAVLMAIALGLTIFLVLAVNGTIQPGNFSLGGLGEPPLVNRQELSLSGIDILQVSYRSESITLLPGNSGQVVLEEYMSSHDDGMMAKITQGGGSLSITGGDRPVINLTGWRAKIKLYLPSEWPGAVSLETSSGSIRTESDFTFNSFSGASTSGSVRVAGLSVTTGDIILTSSSGGVSADTLTAKGDVRLQATSGSVRPGHVQGATITARSSSGSVRMDSAIAATITASSNSGSVQIGTVEGVFELTSTSGGVEVEGGSGHGNAKASSGSVRITLDKGLTGDLNAESTSGSVRVHLPQGTALNFTGSSNSGSVRVPSGGNTSLNERGNQGQGSYGDAPKYTVTMKASSGSVHLDWV